MSASPPGRTRRISQRAITFSVIALSAVVTRLSSATRGPATAKVDIVSSAANANAPILLPIEFPQSFDIALIYWTLMLVWVIHDSIGFVSQSELVPKLV